MKNRRVEARLGRTINIGNHEFIRVDVGLSGDIEDRELLNSEYDKTFSEVNKQLMVRCDSQQERDSKGKISRKDLSDDDEPGRFRRRR